MKNKIDEAVCRYGMEGIYDGAIVGFSGGADSGALLHYLKDRCKCLLAVHVNHMIRGKEAERDEAHCVRICEKYGVELKVFRVDVPALSRERGVGLEEAARDARYSIFNDLLLKNPQYKCIVTAHNANDNAETVVFNLVRGTGANGLCGIKPVLGKVYRPLIHLSRNEIIGYCVDNNIEYVTDSTNSDTDYTRNRIRHMVLPQLFEINPGFLDSCARMGEILRQDEEYIFSEAQAVLSRAKGASLSKKDALCVPRAVMARVLKALSGVNLDYKAVCACQELINSWQAGKMLSVGSGLTFKLEHDKMWFLKNEDIASPSFESQLTDGVNIIEGTDLAVLINCDEAPTGYKAGGSVRLNSQEVFRPLYVRSKMDGDTVKSCGHTKKLKRVLTDLHIPSHERKSLPVICDEKGVLCVPGIIARDGAFDKKGDLIIRIYIKDKE